jgi:hypothetical protein
MYNETQMMHYVKKNINFDENINLFGTNKNKVLLQRRSCYKVDGNKAKNK